MAMLPDAAAVDARRTGENRAGVYTGVWTAGETLGLALGPAVYAARARRRRLRSPPTSRPTGLTQYQPDGALTAIVLGFSLLPAALIVLSLVPAVPLLPRRRGRRPRPRPPTRPRRPPMNDVLARLHELQSGDVPVTGGRTLAYVYDSGLAEADRIGREAVAAYAGSNGLDPTAFPSLLTMENELVGFACAAARRPGDGGGHGHLGRHRVGAARRAGRPRLPARRRAAADGAAGDRARGVPQGGALLRGRGGDGRRRRGVPGTARRDGGRDRRPDGARGGQRPVVRPRRGRPRHRRSPPRPPPAGCAATSTRASAAGCCRTPPGWVARCRRGRSRSRGSPASRSTCTSTPTPPRAPRSCCTATAGAAAPAVLRQRPLAGLHDAQPDDAVDQVRRPARRGVGGGRARSATTGYLALTEQVLDGVDRLVAGIVGDRRRCGSSCAPTRRWSPSPPTRPATSSRSPTR